MSESRPPSRPNELPASGEMQVDVLGRYKILGELGRGGCGIVYRALDPSIGRIVAIKTILARTEGSAGKESRERFRREARSAGVLSHPNIVTVHDFSDSGDPMFIAMEFVEGRTLAEFMTAGPLELGFALHVLRSAADALDYAHTHDIVHRDVKPANFLIVNETGRLKITDFGIAKILGSDEGLTSTGILVGTAQYMSPEQVSEAQITGRSDQFSLAIIAYEMLSGQKPFQGNSWASVIHSIIMANPPDITQYRQNLSPRVDEALRKALSKDPEARYATCTDFCEALEHAILPVPTEPRKTPTQSTTLVPAQTSEVAKAQTADRGPKVTPPEAQEEVAKSRYMKPLLIGAIGGAVVVVGLLFNVRSRTEHNAAPVAVANEPASASQTPSTAASPTTPTQAAPSAKSSPALAREDSQPSRAAVAKATNQSPKQTSEIASRQPPPVPSPRASSFAPSANNPPSQRSPSGTPTQPQTPPIQRSPQQPVVAQTPPPVAPAPTPAVPPRVDTDPAKHATEEQAKRLADEQAKRAADEQAQRQLAEQNKRATDEQARRLADEKAKAAHTALAESISRALKDYQSAYQRKDLNALQAIWPSIPKRVLEEIRSSFREASEVSVTLRPLGDPQVNGNTATVICDRNSRQIIMKQPLQASGQVRIVLSQAGSGWVIQSVEPIKQ